MIRFAVIALAVIAAGHMLLYYSLTQFYHLNHPATVILATTLFLLTATYVASSVAIRKSDSVINKATYVISSLWIGIGLNLDLAAIAAWLISIPTTALDPTIDLTSIYNPLAAASVIYSAYGIWNAFNPRIKQLNVTITGLPDRWKGKTIVHIADLHLGHVFGKKFLAKVVEKVNETNPDLVAITGDLNDGMPCSFIEKLQPIGDLQPTTLFVTGNHDWRALDTVIPALKKHGVKIIDDTVINIEGLQIVGIGCKHSKKDNQDIASILSSIDGFRQGQPTLLLRHIPVEIHKAKELGIHLQLSGHSHSGQLVPFHLITKQIYRGYHYGLHKDGDYNIHVTCGVGTWGPPMRTAGFSEIAVIKIS